MVVMPPGTSNRIQTWWPGWGIFFLSLVPTVLAIWLVPGFVTQDGPAHLYNAHILNKSLLLGSQSPFYDAYQANWRLMPNWGGHLILMGLQSVVSPRVADRLLTTMTLVGFGAAILWLRGVVAGQRGFRTAALLCAILAINVTWLWGFTSFLLGLTILPIVWGLWWQSRRRFQLSKTLLIGSLMLLCYLGHLVSLGIAFVGLGILVCSSPRQHWRQQLLTITLACTPVIPLMIHYLTTATGRSPLEPIWEPIGSLTSPITWARRLAWIDPITIARRDIIPLATGVRAGWCRLLGPSLWLALGLCTVLFGSLVKALGDLHKDQRDRQNLLHHQQRPWWVLAVVLGLGACFSPDGLGEDHGYYLAQRIALVALVALVPVLNFSVSQRQSLAVILLIITALGLQSAMVWDYAIDSNRKVEAILATGSRVGEQQRIATLLIDIRGRHRANPLLHADSLLGVGTGNVIWSNYETRHYYFPVQLRDGLRAPSSREFEEIARLDSPGEESVRADRWERLLDAHLPEIDVLIVWGSDPPLDKLNQHYFGPPVLHPGHPVRLYRQSPETATSGMTPNPKR